MGLDPVLENAFVYSSESDPVKVTQCVGTGSETPGGAGRQRAEDEGYSPALGRVGCVADVLIDILGLGGDDPA